MFSFCSFPTTLIRLAVELALLITALTVVLPRHRKAGLIMAAGALLDLIVGVAIPLLEIISLSVWGTGGNGNDWVFGILFFLPMVSPLAQAFNALCFLISVVMLALRVPPEERDREW